MLELLQLLAQYSTAVYTSYILVYVYDVRVCVNIRVAWTDIHGTFALNADYETGGSDSAVNLLNKSSMVRHVTRRVFTSMTSNVFNEISP